MALSVKVEEMIESFNPLFHMYHLPLEQKYDNPRYAVPAIAEAELAHLKREVRKMLDIYGLEVGNPREVVVAHAFKAVLKRDDFVYRQHFLSARSLWSAERRALEPSSVAFVP